MMKKDKRHCNELVSLFETSVTPKIYDTIRKKLNSEKLTVVSYGSSVVLNKHPQRVCGFDLIIINDTDTVVFNREITAKTHQKARNKANWFLLNIEKFAT